MPISPLTGCSSDHAHGRPGYSCDEDDHLSMVQGRWQTQEGESLMVEGDQVLILGEPEVFGTLQVDKIRERFVVTLKTNSMPPTSAEEGGEGGSSSTTGNSSGTGEGEGEEGGEGTETEEEITGGFSEDLSTIIWADADVWKKMVCGSHDITPTSSLTSPDGGANADISRMTSNSGKTIGCMSTKSATVNAKADERRRWTKNGQLGSRGDLEAATEEQDEEDEGDEGGVVGGGGLHEDTNKI